MVTSVAAASATKESSETPASYEFEGQVVYRAEDGTLIPMVPDAVLVGWNEGRCQWSLQNPSDLKVAPDGTFRVFVEEEVTAVTRVVNFKPGSDSPVTPRCEESRSWPCYRFRAKGCNDGILPFGPEPPARIIELECPGR